MEEASELDFRHDMTHEELVVSDVGCPGNHTVADGSLAYISEPKRVLASVHPVIQNCLLITVVLKAVRNRPDGTVRSRPDAARSSPDTDRKLKFNC